MTQGNVRDINRRSGRVIRRLEEREAVVLRAGGVIQPYQTAAKVSQQGIRSCRAVLRRVDQRGPCLRV